MQTTPTTAAPATLTLAQATQVFEDWENDYRANPDSFYTSEETAAMQVATVSESRAIHFMALLRQRAPAINTTDAPTEREQRLIEALATIVQETMDYSPVRPYDESHLPPHMVEMAQCALDAYGLRVLPCQAMMANGVPA